MSNIEWMKDLEDFVSMDGASKEESEAAEACLGLAFAEEYKAYLQAFGIASMNGHELTGICNAVRLNVVDVTLRERDKNGRILGDLYVIEDLGIDHVITWQNAKGELFQTIADGEPKKIDKGFREYLSS